MNTKITFQTNTNCAKIILTKSDWVAFERLKNRRSQNSKY